MDHQVLIFNRMVGGLNVRIAATVLKSDACHCDGDDIVDGVGGRAGIVVVVLTGSLEV